MFSSRRKVATALVLIAALAPAAVSLASDGDDPPQAQTLAATEILSVSAIFQAKVHPMAHDTTYWFEYGTSSAYGQSTPVLSAGNGNAWVSVAQPVLGLAPGTTYHYRVVAVDEHGTTMGADKQFTTSGVLATPATGGDSSGSGSSGSGSSGSGSSGSGSSGSGSSGSGSSGSGSSGSDSSGETPARPELGETVGVSPSDGVVRIRKPGDTGYGAVEPGGTVPSGSVIDARHGKVSLTAELPDGSVQTGTFWGGVFEVRQPRDGRGYTHLYLRGGKPRGCPKPVRKRLASASARRRRGASLWGRDRNGRFKTHGRNSVATVRGTTWLTTERCTGTLTYVREGAVVVRRKGGRKVTVRAGHAFLARPRR